MSILRTYDRDGAISGVPRTANAVVCVPVFGAYESVIQCLRSLVMHTPTKYPIVVLDDASNDPRIEAISFTTKKTVVFLHRANNLGFVANVNDAFDMFPESDVIVVNSDVIVGPEWAERLREAAYSSPNIATATALTNHGTILSVPSRNHPSPELPGGLLPHQAALRVAQASKSLRPLIPTAVGHCTYFRRSALDVVGLFDEAFSPGYSEEVDFSQRALSMGFVHVCADDVFVFHEGRGSFGRSDTTTTLMAQHDAIIEERYPYYFDWIEEVARDEHCSLSAALLVAGASLEGLRIIVDGFCLGPTSMGTQLVVIETVLALARHPAVAKVTVFVPETIAFSSLETLRKSGAEVVLARGPETSVGACPDAHLVYRPYQINRLVDLEWLSAAAPRVVICQQDCIAFNDPAYFKNFSMWSAYRRVNRLAAEIADGFTFISNASLEQALQCGMANAGSHHAVVFNGADSQVRASHSFPPAGVNRDLSGFYLCLGASYKHKNRLTALRIFEAIRREDPARDLVLAGPVPPHGNSLAEEDAYLLQHPELAAHVWRLGAISDSEREWLYERAALVLYPTLAEGFGLIPFEAAVRHIPSLSTRSGALDEILPADIPTMDPSRPEQAAQLAISLVNDDQISKMLCESLKRRADEFTWDATASRLVDFFFEILGTTKATDEAMPDLSSLRGLHSGREVVALRFGTASRPLSWAVRNIVDRPRLRQALIPPESNRSRLGNAIVRVLDKRAH